MQWHGPNQPLKVREFVLEHPLTYSVDAESSGEPSAIGQQLYALRGSDETLGYWPSYSMMNAGQRRVYLEWMSAGRDQMPSELGYAFVFFYGLERRALKENKDAPIIFAEVMRLRSLHLAQAQKPSGSFLGYTGSLLWFLLTRSPHQWGEEHVKPLVENQRWQADRTPAALYWCSAHSSHLPVWLALHIASGSLGATQGIAFKNLPEEFCQLFQLRYYETWPEGLLLRPEPKGAVNKTLVAHYTASAALETFDHALEVPRKVLKGLDKLTAIWNGCAEDLRPYASLRSRCEQNGQEAGAVAQWEALPAKLRQGQHPAKKALEELVGASIAQQSYAPLITAKFAALLALPKREKFTQEQSLRIARAAESCGYNIEPDARLTGKAYRGDDWVIFFVHENEPFDANRYRAAGLTLKLSLMAATVGGPVNKVQLDLMAAYIQKIFGLNLAERKRLRGLAGLLRGIGVDQVATKTLIDSLGSTQREAVGQLLIAVVAHDGVISPTEKKSLKTAFERLGLGSAKLEEHLAKLCAEESVTIVQRARNTGRGEAIPAPPGEETPLQLDRATIARLLQDTQDVQQALAEAMQVEVESGEPILPEESTTEPMPSASPSALPAATQLSAVEARLQPLYTQLIGRESWPLAEAMTLAREEGIMLSGALESINDWALETYGSPLFYEEGDTLIVELEILT